MSTRMVTMAPAVALACVMFGASAVLAQDTGGATTTTNPPSGQTPPPQAPSTEAPASQSTPPGQAAAPGTTLPDVEVIQQQPKAQPKPVKQAAKPKKEPATPAPPPSPAAIEAAEPSQIKMSPVAGSEIPLEKVPNGVASTTAADIQRTGAVTAQDVLQSRVPGVIVSDLQGNEFQTDVQYRGFSSSPVNGVPQGLAVYQNGVRINEAFGDIVNWDFLPSNAVSSMTVMGSNPVFGLNAIGGAISVDMRDGFNFQGAEFDVRGGSFGRIQGSGAAGAQSGNWAMFIAAEDINDNGWRQFSPAEVHRMYADLGFKNREAEFHVNFTGADNFVGAVTAAPVQLLDEGWNRVYTNPQTTQNDMKMVSINGSVKASNTLTFSGVTYYRHFQQAHLDANILEVEACGGFLCLDGDPLTSANGPVSSSVGGGAPIGSLDRTSQNADSFGGSLQAVEKAKLFDHNNQFLIGGSIDHGHVAYGARSALGTFGPDFVVSPLGIGLTGPDDISPRSLTTTNDYYGVYFTDTFDVTDRLSLTVGGRYNFARVTLEDKTGDDPFLNGSHTYQRFNPMGGLTYQLAKGLTFYTSYAEANRAPTPAELACADPDNPCLIESFLTGDPPLKQVVSRTGEVGFRGETSNALKSDKIDWSFGFFRTLNQDDIISVASPTSGRGFFQNAGDTLRQGIEASISYQTQRLFLYANYAFIDPTFQSSLELASPNNPSPDVVPCSGDPAENCINVRPGDRLPGIPRHRFKAGFDYWLTPKWKFGSDLVAASDQVFFGDESNLNKPLAGYGQVNLHTSYDITNHIQIYGLINNLFDHHYGTFGNYFNTEEGSEASLGTIDFTDARTIVPAMPFAAYGGMKFKF
ncbi:TonB-dependent receptor domain-containing protein [Hyphomicrobium facile]|uniref:Outer membrane receptor proteins, mostly Fe transport n=1 Tax=Hyphomicrobium facile TaxID=51670 RepID=A0A1I7NJU1_9HYPH|nr:TonB-dependent receptor [Hyphomicrobium facile]SFV34931.1 Outer membrane receptor proteins, mostly Fe transport [Hyphomicrobium facile]